MPQVIELADKKVETIFSERDFLELVDKYMGYDSRRYLEEHSGEIEALEEEIKGWKSDNGQQLEEHSQTLYDIEQELDAIIGMVDLPRIDKKRVLTALCNLRKEVNRKW